MEQAQRDRLSAILAPVDGVEQISLPIDRPWQDDARAAMTRLGVDQNDLADWIDTSQSQISYMLGDKAMRHSKYVMPASVALGIELPLVAQLALAGETLAAAGATDKLRSAVLVVRSLAADEKQ